MVKTSDPDLPLLSRSAFDAAIFDLDGVITQSAKLHARVWKKMFDAFLLNYSKKSGKDFGSFDIKKDYLSYVDGKPRYEGVKTFLNSKGIELPYGSKEDSMEKLTICGLGNLKNQLFLNALKDEGVEVFKTSIDLVFKLRELGFKLAIVSSSKNCSETLKSAKISNLFDVQVDGIKSEQLNLKGKPDPDIFLQAADELHVNKKRAVVFEDSIAGVEAAFKGQFGCVIGVKRENSSNELIEHGAHFVIADLSEVRLEN